MTKPEIFGIVDFSVISEMNWTFKPVPWMIEIYGNEIALIGAATQAVRNGWSTIAVHEERVIAIGGLVPQRYWNGKCIAAEAWAVPCIGYEKWPLFLLRWAKRVHELQRVQEIRRIEAFILLSQRRNGGNKNAEAFLRRIGFEFEARREEWLPDNSADCFTLIRTNFQEASKMH